ncbi:MAG TPA: winged helix-turn-helix domain-containing protein [Pirellulales bacterium]|nr:winged helix-turn-helix domain-containing protein [Pirellulales bacterium]
MATASVGCDLGHIGETAGVVWHLLAEKGPLSMAQVVKQTGEARDLVMLALGWLAREDKIVIDNESRSRTVALKDAN